MREEAPFQGSLAPALAPMMAATGLLGSAWANAVLRREWIVLGAIVACLASGAVIGPTQAPGAALLGVGAASLLVWIAARWRAAFILDPNELSSRFGAALCAAAPALDAQTLRLSPPDRRTAPDYVLDRPDSDYAAVFRHLAEATSKPGPGGTPVLAVTAPRAADGGAPETLALVRTLAAQGKSVVAIDCDLRLSRFSAASGLAPKTFVTSIVEEAIPWREVIVRDVRSHAHLICADGVPTPRDPLLSDAFAALICDLKAVYDVVVLACPSVLGLAATAAVAPQATQCILIVRWGASPAPGLRAALKALSRFRAGEPPAILLADTPKAARFRLTKSA